MLLNLKKYIMINNTNSVDNNLSNNERCKQLPSKMVPSESLKSTFGSNTVSINNTNVFSSCPGLYNSCYKTFDQSTVNKIITKSLPNKNVNHRLRVQVQPVFLNKSNNGSLDVAKTFNNNNHIQNESAFNNDNNNKMQNRKTISTFQHITGDNSIENERIESTIQRSEYRENAFPRIEEVHNYAKLNCYSYSRESSYSSNHDDDDDDDEEEEEDEEDDDIADLVDSNEYVNINYNPYFNKKQKQFDAKPKMITKNEDIITHTNIEAIQVEQNEVETSVTVTPDHHARRPMNAFLIFCKRHRQIVKNRYKSLENRAITKILGDWWASLDKNDKMYFTNLAQQNKEVFFSANPNFKWYKLPAPPLRTLNTRPMNTDKINVQETDEDGYVPTLYTAEKTDSGNYFKLADEAQMGELNTLMCNKNKETENALHEVLGETTHFLSTHITNNFEHAKDMSTEKSSKKRLHSDSLSSNSSEEEIVPKKSTRLCKGKIYQELVNSGQIAANSKKNKSSKAQNYFQKGGQNGFTAKQYRASLVTDSLNDSNDMQATSKIRTVSESESLQHYNLVNFDLEEKIKELPALCLDTYLERKRNTKKKKKINSKKRNSSSTSNNKNILTNSVSSPLTRVAPPKDKNDPPPQQAVVGSQKRKARKESITRRDISVIENEVASVISLNTTEFATINDVCVFNQTPLTSIKLEEPALMSPTVNNYVPPLTSIKIEEPALMSPTLNNCVPSANSFTVNPFCSGVNSSNFVTSNSPTSDLLILAEVAANRTEN